MSSKLSLFALLFLLASLFLISSATPVAEVQVGKRCGRYACMDAIPESASASDSLASEPTPSAEESVETPAATQPPAADPALAQDSASTPQNSGALFNANTPVFSCFVALGATATIFTFVL